MTCVHVAVDSMRASKASGSVSICLAVIYAHELVLTALSAANQAMHQAMPELLTCRTITLIPE